MPTQATPITPYQRRQILEVGVELKLIVKYSRKAQDAAREINDHELVEDLQLQIGAAEALLDAFTAEHGIS